MLNTLYALRLHLASDPVGLALVESLTHEIEDGIESADNDAFGFAALEAADCADLLDDWMSGHNVTRRDVKAALMHLVDTLNRL